MKRKLPTKKDEKQRFCGDCVHATIVTRFFTLSVEGMPTLGECPYWQSGCVILSQKACQHFKPRRTT